ncbi:MAG: septum formation protein Maf [Candidatus Omnitrophica bacterium]|nr:septum formation protein Maf [Candidatus Omnitrophota bacterium]
MREIILASASVRRSRILSECGLRHKVVFSDVTEILDDRMDITELVRVNATNKADKVAQKINDSVIIGADTLVVCKNKIIGKPKDEEEALSLLRSFSEEELKVYTGICVIDPDTKNNISGFEESALKVVLLDEKKIDLFFKFLAPYDKAGGFSIEGIGSILFDDVRGSYFNILGLPMKRLYELFEELGLNLLEYVNNGF